MDRMQATEIGTDAALDGWMSAEELAEERWETVWGSRGKRLEPNPMTENELPF